jgi:hypothetical protein
VPIPLDLVQLMCAYLDRFGAGPDGRLFSGARARLLSESSYGLVWRLARQNALTPAQVDSRLAPANRRVQPGTPGRGESKDLAAYVQTRG